jgi:antitoxin component of MazEF toxin-antitoxin module
MHGRDQKEGNFSCPPSYKSGASSMKKPKLEELLTQCKSENRHEEIDFGQEGEEWLF